MPAPPQPEPTNGPARPRRGGPARPPWQRGLTNGGLTLREVLLFRAVQPNQWGCSQPWWWEAARRGSELARCVHTAHFEGVTRGEKATGMP